MATHNVKGVVDVDIAPAINAAIKAAAPGDLIVLPEGEWRQSTAVVVNKPVNITGKNRRETSLFHSDNINLAGENGCFHVQGQNITMYDFTIKAIRTPGFNLRTSAIRVMSDTSNVAMVGMGFKAITASVFLVIGRRISNIQIVGNSANEFYEQFVELACHGSNIRVANNLARSTSGNPFIGSTEPYGLMTSTGIVEGVLTGVDILNNTFDLAEIQPGDQAMTAGIRIGDDFKENGVAYGDFRIKGNTFMGGAHGITVMLLQYDVSPEHYDANGLVEISGNTFVRNMAENIEVQKNAFDHGKITIKENHFYTFFGFAPYKLNPAPGLEIVTTDNLCYSGVDKLKVGQCAEYVPPPPVEPPVEPPPVTPVTYHISPTGNDAANGLSVETAWSPAKLFTPATFKPDDTILFEGGLKVTVN
jgi:hypothetical protein